MPTGGRATLTQFLIEQRRRAPAATGDLNALVTDVSLACKAISRRVAYGALGNAPAMPLEDSPPRGLPAIGHELFLRATEWGGHVAGMVSKQLEQVCTLPPQHPRGKYLLAFDPLDGSAGLDANVTVGSIFSVLRAAAPGRDAKTDDFLQPGTQQVCAGYAIYGPTTMLVLTLGHGTHGFTLEPMLGEWVLSHPDLQVPPQAREFAIDASNSRFWAPAVKRYVDECLAGQTGPRGSDHDMRWIASLVAEAHRILMRGGVFLSPRDNRGAGELRLLCEASPIALLIEQAGGRASDGHGRLLEARPTTLHQRTGFVFGSGEEVERIERYHRDEPQDTYASPLFGKRGLFAQMD